MTTGSLAERIGLLELGYYMQCLDDDDGPTLAAYLAAALDGEVSSLRMAVAALATEMQVRGVSYWTVVERLQALAAPEVPSE